VPARIADEGSGTALPVNEKEALNGPCSVTSVPVRLDILDVSRRRTADQ
jgi:hypothetical protein